MKCGSHPTVTTLDPMSCVPVPLLHSCVNEIPTHQERARYLQSPAVSCLLCVCLHSSVCASRKVNRYLKANVFELFVATIAQILPDYRKGVCVVEQFSFHILLLG